jgi:hypothetical protein
MSLSVVADPELRERLRCLRVIAAQTNVSAIGAATWEEVEQAWDGANLGFVVYASSLPGAPEDAIEQLAARAGRLLVALADGADVCLPSGVTSVPRPIPEETLVLLARGVRPSSIHSRANFNPVDFIQMLAMSGATQVVVISQGDDDMGVIEVRGGDVWTAFDGMGAGEGAFARLIRPEMRARIGPNAESAKERTIFKGLHELMLDSLRRIDEGEVSLPPPLSPRQLEVATFTQEQLARRILELTAEARSLLMQRSYAEAVRALTELSELDPNSQLVRANLEHLRRLGYPK